MTTEPDLEALNRLVGTWDTEFTHPALPGVLVHGSSEISWLEGERFLIHRARTDHPEFPDSISIIGFMDRDRVSPNALGNAPPSAEPGLSMHYFDSRGVFRVFDVSFRDGVWRIWRDAPQFSQRFAGVLSASGDVIDGRWDLRRDDVNWNEDLKATYRRRA